MINIIMAGAGGIARTHVSSLMRIPSANIVGIVDPNKERAEILASTVGATAYKNLDRLCGWSRCGVYPHASFHPSGIGADSD